MIINKAYFKLNNKKDYDALHDLISSVFFDVDISLNGNIGTISMVDNDAFHIQLNKILFLALQDLESNVSFLIVPFFDDLFIKYLMQLNNEVTSAFEVFLRNINTKEVKDDSKQIIESLNKKDIDTIKAFLMCNGNSCVCANELYLHRNSYNYRMNNFINSSSMDIRDFNTLQFISLILCINK